MPALDPLHAPVPLRSEINIRGMKETRMIAMDPWYMPSGDLIHGAIVLRCARPQSVNPGVKWSVKCRVWEEGYLRAGRGLSRRAGWRE